MSQARYPVKQYEDGQCKRCRREFVNYPTDESFGTRMCYTCFESSFDEWDEQRRQKLAEANEY